MTSSQSPRKVRIAHVTTIDLSLRALLLRRLVASRQAGFDVTGISSDGPDVGALRDAGIRHIVVPMSRRNTPLADLVSLVRLWHTFRRERFDVVHTHTPKASLLGQYAALAARVPLRVHTIHGLYFPATVSPKLRPAFVWLERITMLFSHHNFAVNPEDVATAVREKICRPERIELIGNGVDLAKFAPEDFPPERRSELRRGIGLTDDDLVVGIVARLVAEKGYLELFEAAAIVRREEPRARFVCVGGTDHEKSDALRPETARRWPVGDCMRFLGHRTDVASLYSVMDVHVLPSHREGFPCTPMEASAMGVPSIVTDVRGCRQTVDHSVTGLIVPVKAPAELAQAILTLLRDPEKRRQMGEAARQKAKREFDDRAVSEKVLAGYRRLLHLPPEESGGGDASRTAPS